MTRKEYLRSIASRDPLSLNHWTESTFALDGWSVATDGHRLAAVTRIDDTPEPMAGMSKSQRECISQWLSVDCSGGSRVSLRELREFAAKNIAITEPCSSCKQPVTKTKQTAEGWLFDIGINRTLLAGLLDVPTEDSEVLVFTTSKEEMIHFVGSDWRCVLMPMGQWAVKEAERREILPRFPSPSDAVVEETNVVSPNVSAAAL